MYKAHQDCHTESVSRVCPSSSKCYPIFISSQINKANSPPRLHAEVNWKCRQHFFDNRLVELPHQFLHHVKNSQGQTPSDRKNGQAMKTSHSPLNLTYDTEACYRSKLLPLIYKLNTVIQIQKSQIYKISSISFQEP